jgi:hypothetical protein
MQMSAFDTAELHKGFLESGLNKLFSGQQQELTMEEQYAIRIAIRNGLIGKYASMETKDKSYEQDIDLLQLVYDCVRESAVNEFVLGWGK